MKVYRMLILYEMVRCGSKCGGSYRRRVTVPPRFGVWRLRERRAGVRDRGRGGQSGAAALDE